MFTLASIYGRGVGLNILSQDQGDRHKQAKHQGIGRNMHIEIDKTVEQESDDTGC
jgi:hypothetical protein